MGVGRCRCLPRCMIGRSVHMQGRFDGILASLHGIRVIAMGSVPHAREMPRCCCYGGHASPIEGVEGHSLPVLPDPVT